MPFWDTLSKPVGQVNNPGRLLASFDKLKLFVGRYVSYTREPEGPDSLTEPMLNERISNLRDISQGLRDSGKELASELGHSKKEHELSNNILDFVSSITSEIGIRLVKLKNARNDRKELGNKLDAAALASKLEMRLKALRSGGTRKRKHFRKKRKTQRKCGF